MECGLIAYAFHLSFVNSIINLDGGFNHFGQVFWSIHSVNLVFNGVLEAIIEFGRDGVAFLI
jgi:hypothetical protein